METRRCPRCNKLLRADAETCSRCGNTFPRNSNKGTRKLAASWSDTGGTLSQPTNPPASPHRAGHYSGLHPEDQPFQSSFFLRVQRPPTPIPSSPIEEAAEEDELFQPVPDQQEPLWHEVHLAPDTAEPLLGEDERKLADQPTLYPAIIQAQARLRTPGQRSRVVPILISTALLFFLLASGLLTFLLINKNAATSTGPQLQAMPGKVRVGDFLQLTGSNFHIHSTITLTRDTQVALLNSQGISARATTSAQGSFQVRVPITAAWQTGVHTLHATDAEQASSETTVTVQTPVAGPPLLKLETARQDLGTGDPGSISHKNITLTNAGGGQVAWQASSDAAWLSLNPNSGIFAGSALVVITVNRTNLVPQAYLGRITFTQKQAAPQVQVLYVSMTVDTTPADLHLSTASMSFSGTPAQNPDSQIITIQNSGGQELSWAAGSTSSDNADWLSVTPASGQLAANTSATLTVKASSLNMATGSYQGILNFSYADGPQQQITVTLTVNPPPQAVINATPATLSFTTNQGFNPGPQSFTISNTGNAQLNWGIQEDVNGQLYLRVSPTRGSLPPGQSVSVTVTPTPGSAGGPIASTLTILDSDTGTTVHSRQVQTNIAITNEPVINLLTGNLEFDHSSQSTDTSEAVIFDNTGNLPLNWSIAPNVSTPWLTFDSSSGTLAPGEFAFITLRCLSTQMKAGTYNVTVTLKDTDAHTVVASRTFTATLIITN